jgi:hypothetical protein
MAIYNLTNITNSDSFPEMFSAINTLSDGFFGTALIFSIFIISFLALKNYSGTNAFIGSTFTTVILGFLLRALGIVSDQIMFLLIIMTGIAVAIAIWSER